MIGGMTGVLSDVIPFGLSFGNRNNLSGLNLIGLRRAGISNSDMKIMQESYKVIFESSSFRSNIENLDSKLKNNKEVVLNLNLKKSLFFNTFHQILHRFG